MTVAQGAACWREFRHGRIFDLRNSAYSAASGGTGDRAITQACLVRTVQDSPQRWSSYGAATCGCQAESLTRLVRRFHEPGFEGAFGFALGFFEDFSD